MSRTCPERIASGGFRSKRRRRIDVPCVQCRCAVSRCMPIRGHLLLGCVPEALQTSGPSRGSHATAFHVEVCTSQHPLNMRARRPIDAPPWGSRHAQSHAAVGQNFCGSGGCKRDRSGFRHLCRDQSPRASRPGASTPGCAVSSVMCSQKLGVRSGSARYINTGLSVHMHPPPASASTPPSC